MGPVDFIVLGVILLIVALAAWYIIRAKKNGVKCIGCPSDCGCSKSKKSKGKDGSSCSCGCCGCGTSAGSSKVSAEENTEA